MTRTAGTAVVAALRRVDPEIEGQVRAALEGRPQ